MAQAIKHFVVDTGIIRKRHWLAGTSVIPGKQNIRKWPSVSVLTDTEQETIRVIARGANEPFVKKDAKWYLENEAAEYSFTNRFRNNVAPHDVTRLTSDVLMFHVYHLLLDYALMSMDFSDSEHKVHYHTETLHNVISARSKHMKMAVIESEYDVEINRYTYRLKSI